MSTDFNDDGPEAVAIIGMAGRFPGAADLEQFWHNLRDGVESISFFTREELADRVEPALLDDPNYVRANGVLDDIEMFDAEFFGFTPREAEVTDPQHRLFLECAFDALEDSGYDSQHCAGRIGVFAGAGLSTYLLNNIISRRDVLQSVNNVLLHMGNNKDYVPTRVSYKLNLKGPSVNVNTACSSSLVAVHMACQSLLDCECNMALAGGVGIQVPQRQGYLYHEGAILSPDGHCRAFDAKAKGTVSGNGVGIVVLKRLHEAQADGDHIRAVILGSAINNDGAAKIGYTAPSVDGQATVIDEAQAISGVEPEAITYIETHGTGTSLGDPIEFAALSQVFGAKTHRKGFCALGSVKTNVGHLDEAAGVAGLIKTVLALEHKAIPPSLHYEQPNPEIDFANSPFFVNAKLSTWEASGAPRRAGVSSFGIGGTNAHVVLEEAPPATETSASRPWQVLRLSAKTRTALEATTVNLAAHLKQNPGVQLADVAYTLHMGRKEFEHRRIVVCQNGADAVRALESADPQRVVTAYRQSSPRPVVFMFSGQGAQYVNMGVEIFRTEPTFRRELDQCAELLLDELGFDLREVLYPDDSQAPEAARRLDQTAVTQPALFAVEYALARLWMSWGVRPHAMIGHSIGEYVAACLAGVFSLPDALSVVAARGALMQQTPAGGMLAVSLAEDEVRPLLGQQLSLALVNAPSLCAVSGADHALEALAKELSARGVTCRRLRTSRAFHSEMMEPILRSFTDRVHEVRLKPPTIPYLSNLTGRWITAEQATDPGYWAKHLRQTVRFSSGIQQLLKQTEHVLLEVGPGQTLCSLVKRHAPTAAEQCVLSTLPHPQYPESDAFYLMRTFGELWLAGAPGDSSGFFAHEKRRRLPLPTYPFERRRYWIEPAANTESERPPASPAAAAQRGVEDWFYVPSWKRRTPPPRRSSQVSDNACWLVFVDECQLGDRLIEKLRADGHGVLSVAAGDSFARLDDTAYIVNPRSAGDYVALVNDLRAKGRVPQTIVHLWNVTSPAAELAIHRSEDTEYLGFYSLLFLAQAFGAEVPSGGLRIEVVSSHMQQVTGSDLRCPEKATLLGPVRVIPKEYPNIRCRSIDLALPESKYWDDARCVDQLVNELSSDSSTPIIALRGDYSWEQTFEPFRLEAPRSTPPRLREGGVYLITGGLGSMGLAFARSLASEARAKLILLGRTGLLPADQWDAAALFNRLDFDLATDATAIQSWEAAAEEAVGLRDIDAEEALTMDLRALCSSLIGEYFSESGVNVQQGTVYHRDELQNRLGILPTFKRFFGLLLRSLAEDGIVEIDAESIRFVNFDRLEEAQTVRQRLLAAYPEFSGLVRLLEHCAGHYREALSGAIKSISVLYPDGTAAFMNECGQQTPEYARDRIYLKLASQLVAAIQQQSTGSKLRILEVGGGTGGLTRHVLGALANHDIEYHFTDLGQAFVRDAEEEAAADGIDCMQFGVLDISQDPQPQGYRKQSYDILLGYNVVHATRDIAATTKHLHSLLSPNGVLLLVEATRLRRWDEMIWGLTEGWWHFTDEQLRIDSPLLSLDAWDQLLRKEGFQTVESYPRDQGKRSTTDAGILIAQRSRPQRDASPRPLADLENSGKTREAIAKVKEIEQLGGEVLVIQADVADQQQMRAALSQVLERFGELHGVIHTAGILGQGLIQTKTAADAQQVLAPKVTGTLILDAILKEQGIEPDFFVYCSSLAALAPIVGQVDYCAANAFLDAFAAYQAQHSDRPAIAIDWGFWQELGMIGQAKMSSESKRQIVKEIREKGWSNAGVEAFRCILASCTSAQVVVSPAKMEDLLAGDPAGDQRPGSPNGKPSIRVESDNGNAAGRSQEEPLSRPVDHPLFDECLVEGTARESYVSHFDVRRHWVLNEHRVMGKAVLPGTAYLELARAAFEAHAQGDPIELREVYFLSPLIVEDGETKEVRTILNRRISGFEFVVVSRLRADRDEWQEHARGEISRVLVANSPRHDVQAVSRGCDQPDIMVGKDKAADTATRFEARVQQFPPRWRNFKRLRFGSQQGVATLELSAEFARELESYKLHPALMDMATGFLSIHDEFDRGLPFSYQRIRIWQPLGPVINSYARSVAHDRPDERKYDVTIMDDAGRELVDVQGYTLREFDDEDHSEQSPSHELEAAVSSDDDRNFCVEIDSPGSLSTLVFRAAERRKPGPGEVEIEVCEAGLNFIEVLYALGMLPEPPGGGVKFGLECAGKIAALGEEVTDFHVGDEVFAFAQPAFSRFVTSSTAAIGRKPPHLTFAEAATIPAAFTTAYYSLITQGRLKPGERVLIHAAAGGVGLAAVNIAQWRDAEIFVTAGTPEKRDYLRSVGIAHVMDSRSLDFAEQVLQATDGQGVDVVLNSLGGEFIKASLNVLARYGRFLELGKRDIFQNTPLEMGPFEKHLSFMAIDIGTDLPDFKSLWRDVVAQVQCQVFRPLPHQTFPVTRLTDAFEYMAGAKHIGKIVVKIDAVQKAALLSRGLSHRSTGRPLRAIIGGDETMRPKAGIQKEQGGAAASRLEESQAGASRPDPSHARPALKTAFREPCGETEQTLVKIWQELLGVSQIGVDDNFFELRGDSLLAAQVMSRLYQALQVKLPLSIIFERPTVAGLAECVEQLRDSARELETVPQRILREGEVEHEV